ncbi:hypothetical protein HanXRQr2_Chr03g0106631 [Helianthus annuus]|uniref:Uncharacterized protein n=1 Tax=Helianthus annuus TaxID=4232 RepID=A0A9K3JEP2_HELAN|nr:hypothetical protein HanXRQr2_Chr03g0106631 [Helianthus annuus]
MLLTCSNTQDIRTYLNLWENVSPVTEKLVVIKAWYQTKIRASTF